MDFKSYRNEINSGNSSVKELVQHFIDTRTDPNTALDQTIRCYTMLHYTIRYYAILHFPIQYHIILYDIILQYIRIYDIII